MMRRALLLAALLLPLPAIAQAPAGLAETLLHIVETAEVTRAPDEVVASLRAEARAGTAAAAQEAVNRQVASAVARAQGVPGVRVSTGGYWTGRADEGRSWQAAQTVTLRAPDGAALLELTGALQATGLATAGLQWTLTRDAARAAREEASRLALDALRRRAEAVAGQLGLVLVGLREVRIDAPEATPQPRAMAMARATAAAPPVALAEDVVVSAAVSAVVVLRRR
jgi:uncharacterized protein YggE